MIGALLRRIRHLSEEVLGINARNVDFIYPLNPRANFPRADDKLHTKELLSRRGIPVPLTLGVYRGFGDLERLERDVSEFDEFVIKPSSSFGGKGIQILRRRKDSLFAGPENALLGLEDIRYHITQILTGVFSLEKLSDTAFLEELLEPEEVLGSISYGGLPDIRVIVHRGSPAMCMVRVPTRASRGRANLHQGALGVGVDMETGRTTGAVSGNLPVDLHPDTGRRLDGIVVPQWPAVLDMAREAAGCIELGYVGVDVVIDRRRGPLVIELNARPGLTIQLANRRGLARILRGGRP